MKRLFFSVMALLSAFSLFAQNGGQYPESGSLKLEYSGTPHTMKILNKQSCEVQVEVTYDPDGGNNKVISTVTVPGNSFSLYSTPLTGKLTCRPLTNCSGLSSTDLGVVEYLITPTLPVKFTSLKATPGKDNILQVDFEIAEASNVKQFNIQIFKEGTWQTIGIVWPDALQPNKKYSTKINLSPKK